MNYDTNPEGRFDTKCQMLHQLLDDMEQLMEEILNLLSDSQGQLFCDKETLRQCLWHRVDKSELCQMQVEAIETLLSCFLD